MTEDVQLLCRKATSPRSFIQAARHEFQSWLDGSSSSSKGVPIPEPMTVTQVEIDEVIKTALLRFEESLRKSFDSEMVLEQEFFGRIRSILETLLLASGTER